MSIGFGSSCCVAPRWRSGIAKNREGHGSCAVRATSERSEVAPVLIVLPGVRENSSTLQKASPRSLVQDPHLGCRLRASEVGAVCGGWRGFCIKCGAMPKQVLACRQNERDSLRKVPAAQAHLRLTCPRLQVYCRFFGERI